MVRTRVSALASTLVSLLALAALGAAPSSAVASTHGSTVTVLLRAPHPQALQRLATRHHLGRLARVRRARTLQPSTSTRRRVVATLQRRGFRVTAVDTWSVTAQAPDALAQDLTAHPDDLGSGVAAVAPARRGVFRPMVATTGDDYRDAYGSTATRGDSADASQLTVATLQFSRFDARSLTAAAARIGLPDPVASGRYTGVLVGSGPTDSDGADEVALDQESILATSPGARQRAYFAENSTDGFVRALQAVANDAAAQHIVALSISWGGCERDFTTDQMRAFEGPLAALTAAGVTVFNSSGDSGIYGCGDDQAVVSFPASSPSVVAVGGTRLTGLGNHSWLETGWSCSTFDVCALRGGSGGGASSAYSRRTWGPTSSSRRLVPDIAAVADPATGFTTTATCGLTKQFGGTSLAAPVVAALFADALSAAGFTSGVGDIHRALYAAAGQSTVFRDVTSGSNGDPADKSAYDPSTSAGVGYDTVTGLGAVRWPAFVATLGAPTTTAVTPLPATTTSADWNLCPTTQSTGDTNPVTTVTPVTTTPSAWTSLRVGHTRGTARWTTSGATHVLVRIRDVTAHRVVWTARSARGAHRLRLKVGHLLRVTVTAVDADGRTARASSSRRVR